MLSVLLSLCMENPLATATFKGTIITVYVFLLLVGESSWSNGWFASDLNRQNGR